MRRQQRQQQEVVVDGRAAVADELAAEFTESEAEEWGTSGVEEPRQLLLPQ